MTYPNINDYKAHNHTRHCQFERVNKELPEGSIRQCVHGRVQILARNTMIQGYKVWRDVRFTDKPIIWWRAKKMLREFNKAHKPPVPLHGQRPASNPVQAAPMTHRPKAPRK